ncbi:MAG: AtpZ/AtpI family protein [Candidatus Omnitrophota bacterium]|jgi:Putative F0F1-ATPase subunit Ca2+/Mg2+ transporter|nr:AtpZ/AtpI family protein [Candidatus Omnitrophota bacterium]
MVNFGWTMAGEFLFCFFVGYFADQKLGTGYTWTLTGVGAGTLLIVYELWKILRR